MRPGPPRVVSLTYAVGVVRPVPDCTMISELVAVTVAVGREPLTEVEPTLAICRLASGLTG